MFLLKGLSDFYEDSRRLSSSSYERRTVLNYSSGLDTFSFFLFKFIKNFIIKCFNILTFFLKLKLFETINIIRKLS